MPCRDGHTHGRPCSIEKLDDVADVITTTTLGRDRDAWDGPNRAMAKAGRMRTMKCDSFLPFPPSQILQHSRPQHNFPVLSHTIASSTRARRGRGSSRGQRGRWGSTLQEPGGAARAALETRIGGAVIYLGRPGAWAQAGLHLIFFGSVSFWVGRGGAEGSMPSLGGLVPVEGADDTGGGADEEGQMTHVEGQMTQAWRDEHLRLGAVGHACPHVVKYPVSAGALRPMSSHPNTFH
jgi:hypothetical protein